MAVQYHDTNILAHISDEKSLSAQVASVKGCITLLSFAGLSLEACYSLSGNKITVSVTLKTPLGDVNLGSATLDAANPSIKLHGGLDGFTAEVEFTFDFSNLTLTISGKVCAPLAGCKSGSTTIHV